MESSPVAGTSPVIDTSTSPVTDPSTSPVAGTNAKLKLKDLIHSLLQGLGPLLSSRKLPVEDCCASLALNLQSRGFEAHPLRVEVQVADGVRPHCVVLAKNDGTVDIKSFEGSDFILVELLDLKEFRELFGGEAIRYNCEKVRESIFDPLAHLTSMEKGKALLLSHLFV